MACKSADEREGRREGDRRDSGAPPRALRRLDARLPRRPDLRAINPAIPLFFIGRNSNGFWIAREAEGVTGGLFLCRQSAIHFANASARRRGWEGSATMLVSERFELDLDNKGNFLVAIIKPAKRMAARLMSEAVRRVGGRLRTAPRALLVDRAPGRSSGDHEGHFLCDRIR